MPRFWELASGFFTLLLLGGVPVLALATARDEQIRRLPRVTLYFYAAASQWILALLGVVLVLAAGKGFAGFGFRAVSGSEFAAWAGFLTAVSVAALGLLLVFERRGWWPEESELVHLLVPETGRERLWSALIVAPTAALCEEFLYRGYLLAEVSRWLHSASWGLALSAVAFGAAHAYQRLNGAVRAALLGALLAYPVTRLGTLYPSMAAHFLIDAVALLWLGPRFLKPAAEGTVSGNR